MVYGGGDGCARWTRSELYREHGEGLGTNTRRAVRSLVGTRGSLRGLAAQAVCASVDIGGGSPTISLLELVDRGKCLGKLYRGKERSARR